MLNIPIWAKGHLEDGDTIDLVQDYPAICITYCIGKDKEGQTIRITENSRERVKWLEGSNYAP